MSILNVLLAPDRLLVAVDTWAEDARTGAQSAGAKALLIPQHQIVLATRGSAQFFLHLYQRMLLASYRANFGLAQVMREMAPLIDQLWPAYEAAATHAGISKDRLCTELVLGGWAYERGQMAAWAYAKDATGQPAIAQPLSGGLASPGEPLRGRPDSFAAPDVLAAARLQAEYLNTQEGRVVAGGRLIAATLTAGQATISDLGPI